MLEKESRKEIPRLRFDNLVISTFRAHGIFVDPETEAIADARDKVLKTDVGKLTFLACYGKSKALYEMIEGKHGEGKVGLKPIYNGPNSLKTNSLIPYYFFTAAYIKISEDGINSLTYDEQELLKDLARIGIAPLLEIDLKRTLQDDLVLASALD